MKQKLFILWLMLLTGAAGVRAAEAYTYFDPSDGSLNFCYDNNRSSIKKEGYTTYNLNTGSNLPAWKEINSKVKELYFFSSFANYRPTSCYGWGYYMENLTKVTNIGYLNTSSVTNMGLMFCHCKNLTSLNVSGFNTSNVTSMTSMFEGCAKLTSLSVGSWSTSKVTDFSGMFYGCSGLTSLSVSNWNTSSATTFRYMFADCKALTSLDVSKFTTSKVTSMYCMFYNCNKLATINVSGFNTANVTTMFGMFYSCWAVTSLDVSGFNTSKVTTMAKMFTNCSSITSLDVTNFNTTKVTDMNNMFFGCSKLLALDLNSFNTSEVTDMSYMFYNCSSMVYLINTYNFWFSSSTTTKSMFGGNGKLKALCVSASMCSYLASDALSGIGTSSSPCTLYYSKSVHPSFSSITPDYQILKGGYFKSENIRPYAVYNNNALTFYYDDNETQRSGSVFDINTGTNRPAWYSYNPYVKSITVNSNFANARPTSCYEWFSGCSNLTSVSGFTYFNTSKVTTMAYMFKGCSSLSSLDLYWSNYITSNVTSMGYMFYGCSNLTSLLISGFNTSNVTDFGFMFYGCSKLSSINVSNFNTAKATYMVSMFQGCSNLTSISVSNFNTANAKSWMDQMFYGCSKLTSLDISSFTLSSSSAMMKNCTSLTYLKVPSTGSNLNTNACEGVGTTSKPCTLDPTGFTPSKEATGDGWFKWKTGYFLDNKAYANLSSDKTTLTFFYDKSWQTRTGNNYSLNTGSNAPAWHSYASGVTSVVFNTTFASARPTSCYEWFDGMTNLISITNMSSYLNTSQVTNMAYMFYNCKKLASVALSGFNTASVTSMRSMFYNCNNLPSIDVSKFNTTKVTDMEYMFYGCSKLPSLNIGNFNLSSLTASTQMMRDCSGLKTLTIPSTANKLDNTACVSVGTKTAPCELIYPSGFTPEKTATGSGWYQWKGGYFKEDAPAESYAWLSSDGKKLTFCHDTQKASRTGTTYALNTGSNNPGWYDKRTSITSVEFYSAFADAEPTSCYRWFYGMSNLASITGLKYLETGFVTNMASMFNGCTKLTSLDLSKFNTTSVTSMSYMFYKCSKLTSLDLGNFETSGVRTMKDMFANCTALKSVQLYSGSEVAPSFGGPMIPEYETTFTTESITDLTSMFENCSSLKTFEFPGLTLESSTATANMCKGCTAMDLVYVTTETLNYLDATAFDGVGATTECCLEMPYEFTPDITSRTFPYDATDGVGYVMWKSGKFVDFLDAYAVYMGGELTFYFDRELSSWNAAGVTDDGPFPYKVNITNESPGWLEYATKVTKVEFDKSFKDYLPNTTYRWFYGMTKLTSITGMKANLNTSKATSLASMFNNCASLKSVDVSNLNTSKATSLNYMFYKCAKLSSLDISGFTLKSTQTTTAMMQNCTGLKTLKIPATAGYLNAEACTGVGTKTNPCTLVYPEGFTPEKQATGSGWFQWKSGYFKDDTKYPLGDVNHDGSVSIVDASLVTEYVLGNTPVVFFIENADVNNDGSVTVTDVSKIIEMVLNNSAASAPATAREAAFDRLWLTANGNHCLLHLDTPEQYNAMHLTLRLPEGGAIGNVRMSSTRSAGHHAEMRPMGGGLYNIVLHASDNAVLRSNDTALLHFDLAGCQPRDVEVVAVQSCNNIFETVMSAGTTTGIEVVETTDDTDGDAYNAAGVRVTKNTRGVVIKNGMKKIK